MASPYLIALVAVLVLAACAALRFRRWMNEHLTILNTVVSTIGGIASLFIAFFAYNIDRQIHSNNLEQARTNRSVTLSNSILNDVAIGKLAEEAIRVERQYSFAVQNDGADEESNTDSDVSRDEFIRAKIDSVVRLLDESELDLYPNLVLLLQHVDRVVRCIGDRITEISDEIKCDPQTFLALSGSSLADLYFIMRPIYFCDKLLKNDPAVNQYALFVYEYKKQEQERQDRERRTQELSRQQDARQAHKSEEDETTAPAWPIYLSIEQAVRGGHNPDDPDDKFIVVEFPHAEFCEYYETKVNSVLASR